MQNTVEPKVPSKWLLFIVAIFLVVGPFTTPNGLWFCWCLSGSLTYIYINMNMQYRRWEKEQLEQGEKRDSKKQR